MPLTIPYDPSFTLGSIIPQDKVERLLAISSAQVPVDEAEEALNSLISLKNSLGMTVRELADMGVKSTDLKPLTDSLKTLDKEIADAAKDYATKTISFYDQFKKTKDPSVASDKLSNAGILSAEVESPIDYNRSVLKKMPISADSLKMNVQYFSFDENNQNSETMAAQIGSYVSESLDFSEGGFLGIGGVKTKQQTQMQADVATQINSQYSRHSIAGTLVIAIRCTHKNAQIFAPFVLDPDKAVTVWNKLSKTTRIDTSDPEKVKQLAEKSSEDGDKDCLNILSGATYGSAFVGMVHVLNTTETISDQEMMSIASSLQTTIGVSEFLGDGGGGGYGESSSFSNSAKNLLSGQNIQSHCSMTTMGIIPSIKSNQVQFGVQGFVDFDPAKEMDQLAVLQNITADASNSIGAAATAARTKSQMKELEVTKIKSALSGLAAIDHNSNQMIDINSMMTAMDDYIQKCISGGDNVGVPINFFLKPITQDVVALTWLNKYYPHKSNDSEQGSPKK